MSNLPSDRLGWQKTRPIRIAFLVEVGEHSDLVLDAIFANSYARWGGRFSLIVACDKGRIEAQYWSWLEQYDPDLIYSYVELSSDDVLEIHERLVPADYIFHEQDENPRSDVATFRPKYNFSALSSLSTIFRLGRHRPASQGRTVKILDSWHTENATRFTLDNFGTYQTSALTGQYPNDASEVASLLTVVSEEFWNDRKYAVPQDLDRIPSENAAYSSFVEGRATSMSMLSALFTNRTVPEDDRWGGAFNLIVGDTFADRLMYWNSRLLIPGWLDSGLCGFRMNLSFKENRVFIKMLAKLLNDRNFVKGNRDQAQLRIRSASHSEDELREVLDRLQAEKLWGPAEIEIVPYGHVIPGKDALRRSQRIKEAFSGPLILRETEEFRWTPPVAYPAPIMPDHLQDAPYGQAFTLGRWAVDLAFEAVEPHPNYGNKNAWILPKRWRMASAFRTKFHMRGPNMHELKFVRTNDEGKLTVFAGVQQVLASVSVPIIEEAMQEAICTDSAVRQSTPTDPPWPKAKMQWMRPSNEANHLIGVLGLSDSLSRAQQLLLHPFLQKLFGELGGAPNLADADVKQTVNTLIKRARGKPVFDITSEPERQALASMIVKAAQSIKAPRMFISLDDLRRRWNEYRIAYYAEHPSSANVQEDLREQWDRHEMHAVDNVLGEMRSQRMMFQGYPWKCDACQHRNWADFHALGSFLKCDVCAAETELPVDIPWHFQANEFLIESLRSHSVLSLLWVLSALSGRARTSFFYLEPTCFGFERSREKCDAEADLLALVDGQTFFCEIKSSWRSLRANDLITFVKLAKRLRPNKAMLAVMESGHGFEAEIDATRLELEDAQITFELLTPDKHSVDASPGALY